MPIRARAQVVGPVVLATALVIVVASILFRNGLKIEENTRLVAHTHDVIGQLERTLSTVKDAETGQRGYLLTGEERYLEPYHSALAQVDHEVARLRSLTADNAQQQARVAPIEAKIRERIDQLKATMEAHGRDGIDGSRRLIASGRGKALMDELRRMIGEMADEEQRLLERRERDSRAALATMKAAYVVSLIGSLAVTAALYWALERYLRARDRGEADLREQRRWFEVTLTSIGDALIATDPEGRVTFINPVARALCGWPGSEAVGRPLPEVFRIVNETTRAVVENPVEKVLETGHVQGLANHTVLIARDGSERPIEDSAAPIMSDDGAIKGVVLVFHDVSDRKLADHARERRAKQLHKLAEISARINTARDVDSVVGVVTEEARGLIGARRAATGMVLDPHNPHSTSVVSIAPAPSSPPAPRGLDGRAFYELVNREERPIRLLDGALTTDPQWRALEAIALVKPSRNGWLAAPLVGRGGKTLGLLQLADKEEGEFSEDDEVILLQLSRLAVIAVENARLYEELRANDRRKDEFLAMLAHELRNPLAAIGNAVTLATRGGQREHVDWSMGVITRQMKHLTRLIDDLMDVSRISRGRIELRRTVIDAAAVLESAAATARPLIDERRHSLELDLEQGGLWVNADPTRLEQVIVNLLNNAAKYSDNAGRIRLTARNRAGEVVMSVRDDGVGIPPEKLPQMFELFAQGDRSLARSEGGLGIGLTVVKKLVELHGGSVAARSDGPGTGCEFTIRLPAVERADDPTAGEPPRLARRSYRILVVDDSVDTAQGMAEILTMLGHEVSVAHSGPLALEAAREKRPEFVLLDIGLPGMDGYEVAARLRREEDGRAAVIIAVSGYGQDEDRRRSKEAGFDHHLVKPVDHDALLALIDAGSLGP